VAQHLARNLCSMRRVSSRPSFISTNNSSIFARTNTSGTRVDSVENLRNGVRLPQTSQNSISWPEGNSPRRSACHFPSSLGYEKVPAHSGVGHLTSYAVQSLVVGQKAIRVSRTSVKRLVRVIRIPDGQYHPYGSSPKYARPWMAFWPTTRDWNCV